MKPVAVLSDAAEDIERARDFYEFNESGVGYYFVDSIMADIESLALFHGIHAKHLGSHRVLASRFPFGIYYEETPSTSYVFAVLDMRRSPLWIRKELDRR